MLATGAAVTTTLTQVDREKIYLWINEISSPESRDNVLLELSKKKKSVPDLAPMLRHSCGTIAALLQAVLPDLLLHFVYWRIASNFKVHTATY